MNILNYIQLELYKNSKVCDVNLDIMETKMKAQLLSDDTTSEIKKMIERDLKRLPHIRKSIKDLEIFCSSPIVQSVKS